MPAPYDCVQFRLPPEIVPVGAHFEIHPAAGPLPLTGADELWMCALISLVPELPIDAATLAVLADALPPGFVPTLTMPVAVPTVAFSMHLPGPADPTVGPRPRDQCQYRRRLVGGRHRYLGSRRRTDRLCPANPPSPRLNRDMS
ncbi:hypothetical protein [Nocardia vinacea]|uniref:hypothetical protein n=1 Tax=Nocardia vinacea TaxID=96468 RepID=UPI003F4DF80E